MLENTISNVPENEEKDIITCYFCGCVIEDIECAEYTYISSYNNEKEWVCDSCLDNEYFTCDCCGNRCLNDEGRECEGDYLCEDCIENHCCECEDCGRLIYTDNAYWVNRRDCYLCENCYDSDNDERIDCIEDYHYYNTDKGYLMANDEEMTQFIGFGFELEVEAPDFDACRDTAEALHDKFNRELMLEKDGSLTDYGFEIITRPMSLKYYENEGKELLKEVTSLCLSNGCLSDKTRTCGLHIHVSRAFFDNDEQIDKLCYFYEVHYKELMKIGRRKETSYCLPFFDTERDITFEDIKDTNKTSTRYHAVNLATGNKPTIEFRGFKGTLNLYTLYASIDLVLTLCRNAKTIPLEELDNSYLWLKGIKPETREYILKRNTFINELAGE